MVYCISCGKEMKDGTKFCPSCGAPASGKAARATSASAPQTAPTDRRSAGLAVFSFFFTPIGAILFLVWHNRSPLKAISCAKGLAISIIVGTAILLLTGLVISRLYASYLPYFLF